MAAHHADNDTANNLRNYTTPPGLLHRGPGATQEICRYAQCLLTLAVQH
jgi:hypothetical protein